MEAGRKEQAGRSGEGVDAREEVRRKNRKGEGKQSKRREGKDADKKKEAK